MRKKRLKFEVVAGVTPPGVDLERELDLARARLDAKGRAQWLLEFAYADLSQLSQGARADLSYEVLAFGAQDAVSLGVTLMGAFMVDDVAKLVESFQREVRERFDQARAGHSWTFTYPQREKEVSLFNRFAVSAEKVKPQKGTKVWIENLLAAATDLVEKDREKFGICENPRCKSPFVAQRKGRVRFCSPRCSAYVRVTNKIERDKKGARRERGGKK